MMKFWLQLVVVFMLFIGSGGYYTASYFFDIEDGEDNILSATDLDLELAGLPIDGELCHGGGELTTEILTLNSGSLVTHYDLSVENTEEPLCNNLSAVVKKNGETLYEGLLPDLIVTDIVLPPASSTALELSVSLSPQNTIIGECNFTTKLLAYQEGFGYQEGFYDEETANHHVSGDPLSCNTATSTVNLYLNKHISGETLGYELSDFSYRVTGPGVDQIVPHDSFIALPTGYYSIEEIVPEDFVKEDWRIGWYGQCESGNAYSTSITIDEGNIDHGILYCEADNQYRPDSDNTPDDEVESDSEEGTVELYVSTEDNTASAATATYTEIFVPKDLDGSDDTTDDTASSTDEVRDSSRGSRGGR